MPHCRALELRDVNLDLPFAAAGGSRRWPLPRVYRPCWAADVSVNGTGPRFFSAPLDTLDWTVGSHARQTCRSPVWRQPPAAIPDESWTAVTGGLRRRACTAGARSCSARGFSIAWRRVCDHANLAEETRREVSIKCPARSPSLHAGDRWTLLGQRVRAPSRNGHRRPRIRKFRTRPGARAMGGLASSFPRAGQAISARRTRLALPARRPFAATGIFASGYRRPRPPANGSIRTSNLVRGAAKRSVGVFAVVGAFSRRRLCAPAGPCTRPARLERHDQRYGVRRPRDHRHPQRGVFDMAAAVRKGHRSTRTSRRRSSGSAPRRSCWLRHLRYELKNALMPHCMGRSRGAGPADGGSPVLTLAVSVDNGKTRRKRIYIFPARAAQPLAYWLGWTARFVAGHMPHADVVIQGSGASFSVFATATGLFLARRAHRHGMDASNYRGRAWPAAENLAVAAEFRNEGYDGAGS